ncbi:MAG TPA: DUF6282 family protein [Sedimentibacter sp.]|nr:DUF6282 family protein [Sedimentibacter sp.]
MSIIETLQGAYDLHVHTAPDVMERKLDDMDMAERCKKIGMKGFGIKSHYFCTAERAKLVKRIHPEVDAIGMICLNHSVGGLNPMALEMAARDGAKIVSMPTVDTLNERNNFEQKTPKKPAYWAQLYLKLKEQGKVLPAISILDGSKIRREVEELLDIVAEYNLILVTGHIGKEETYELVKAARNHNVKKVMVTHPNTLTTYYTKEEQKELADIGAYMEHCFNVAYINKISWEELIEQIRYVGCERCVLSTDLGQPTGPYPDEGLLMFVTKLFENGFTKDQIKRMTIENTNFLVKD